MNTSSYTDEQLLNLVNNSILKFTEFQIEEFTGGSISVTSVHKNTKQNYKVNLYFGYKGKNSINRSFDIKHEFYFIWCKAVHLKVMSIANDKLGADFNELNELMQNPENSNKVVSSKLDSNKVVSTQPKGSSKDTLQDKIKVKLSEYPNININAFNEWMAYKKYKNIGAVTKVLNFLSRYDKNVQQQIVDKSIMNQYQGLFEPNGAPQKTNVNVDVALDNNIYDLIEQQSQQGVIDG